MDFAQCNVLPVLRFDVEVHPILLRGEAMACDNPRGQFLCHDRSGDVVRFL